MLRARTKASGHPMGNAQNASLATSRPWTTSVSLTPASQALYVTASQPAAGEGAACKTCRPQGKRTAHGTWAQVCLAAPCPEDSAWSATLAMT